ncbi:hypothetical protein LSH36_467g03012 [Paralvinella palmiformis]|uniref:Uncharacterized protein n=1 Tax=Paralvinella palmiformis TaxID=53620 RepID=A0AAD9MXJ1_9ANNE|nr:hypothetical protein LSH36_467g03012 [Paralvinella palmiformis]
MNPSLKMFWADTDLMEFFIYHHLVQYHAREFVRARTVAAIPVSQHLSPQEIKTCYNTSNMSTAFCHRSALYKPELAPWTAHNKGDIPEGIAGRYLDVCVLSSYANHLLLPGEIRPRSHSAESKRNQDGQFNATLDVYYAKTIKIIDRNAHLLFSVAELHAT